MSAPIRRVYLTSIAVALIAIDAKAGGAALSIVGVDRVTGISSVTRFAEGSDSKDTWTSHETIGATDIEVLGGFVYLAEYDGSIQKYSLNGTFERSFPGLPVQAGAGTHSQHLGADEAGNLYSAFSGASGVPRKSFRLSNDGTILTTYSHGDLVFPNGIDAASNGDVYIANGSTFGAGRRLYRFQRNGKFVSSYPLSEPGHITKLEIDEGRDRLYISGTLEGSVYVYDIAAGDPVFSRKLQAVSGIRGIAVESTTGRLFGTSGTDVIEVALDSSGVTSFARGAATLSAISIVPVPEPSCRSIALASLPSLSWFRRIKKRSRGLKLD
jgi:hypothetical protein